MTKKAVKLEDFKVDTNLSMPRKIASFLDWAAQAAPGRPIPYQLLTKVCAQMPRLPSENDHRVKGVRNSIHRAKNVLMDEYARGLVSIPGMGVRATVDSEDVARHQTEKDARRITSAIRSADRTRSIIRLTDIKDKDLRTRVSNVNSAIRSLAGSDIVKRLLPEPSKE